MPKQPTPETSVTDETEAKRAELLAQLADLPTPPAPKGLRPGSVMGEGLTAELVPFTAEFFLDIEARRKEDPNYQLHEVIAQTTQEIKVNNVSFTVLGGVPCKLPTPHYTVYKESLDQLRKIAEQYAKPANPPTGPGYISPVHLMGGTWSKTES